MRFVDTNVLIYAVGTDAESAAKRKIARALLDERDLVLSVQVLQEFYVQSTTATRGNGLSHEQATALIEAWMRYPTLPVSVELMQNALASRARWQISYWDAAIVEGARLAGCSTLLSEDLQDGMNFAGVRCINPFSIAG